MKINTLVLILLIVFLSVGVGVYIYLKNAPGEEEYRLSAYLEEQKAALMTGNNEKLYYSDGSEILAFSLGKTDSQGFLLSSVVSEIHWEKRKSNNAENVFN